MVSPVACPKFLEICLLLLSAEGVKKYGVGSFGAMDPASHDLYMFLEKLQEQQKEVVNLIKERQRIIAERDGTPIPAGPVFVPGGTTVPASIKAQSPATVKDRSPASMKTWAASPAGAKPLYSLPCQFRRSVLAVSLSISPPLPPYIDSKQCIDVLCYQGMISRRSLLQESLLDKVDQHHILNLCRFCATSKSS